MDEVERRKGEHLQIAAAGDVEAPVRPGWHDVHLVHSALPAASLDEIELSAELLGHTLRAPLVIAAMTGGHPAARQVNRRRITLGHSRFGGGHHQDDALTVSPAHSFRTTSGSDTRRSADGHRRNSWRSHRDHRLRHCAVTTGRQKPVEGEGHWTDPTEVDTPRPGRRSVRSESVWASR